MQKYVLLLISVPLLTTSVLVHAADAELAETGQVSCFDTSGNTVTCSNTGQDADHRAGAAWPNPRFAQGSGIENTCITDRLTGLMWFEDSIIATDWLDALTISRQASYCGYDDWRLPNVLELESLLNYEEPSSGWLMGEGFGAIIGDEYWTSTTSVSDPKEALAINMLTNFIHSVPKTSLNNLVLLVRGGD